MLKQLFAVISMSLQTVPQRLGASSVIVIGIAGVVAVLVSVLAMGAALPMRSSLLCGPTKVGGA